jgi:hypothetical protein
MGGCFVVCGDRCGILRPVVTAACGGIVPPVNHNGSDGITADGRNNVHHGGLQE